MGNFKIQSGGNRRRYNSKTGLAAYAKRGERMVEPYRLPTATILAAASDGEVATVTINISQEDYLTYPVAPASLRRTDADILRPVTCACVFELHQLIAREGTRLVFETYLATQSLPAVGGECSFGSW